MPPGGGAPPLNELQVCTTPKLRVWFFRRFGDKWDRFGFFGYMIVLNWVWSLEATFFIFIEKIINLHQQKP